MGFVSRRAGVAVIVLMIALLYQKLEAPKDVVGDLWESHICLRVYFV